MAITLNKGQENTVKKMVIWYTLQENKKYFSIAGSAGTGKSTMLSFAIRTLGLDIYKDVCYGTPTGKAALVLNRKGIPASTIHKLIYRAEEYKEPVLDENKNPKKDKDGNTIFVTKIRFIKRLFLEGDYKLIVIDEGSMVTQKIWEDLLSFGIRIVILSDQKQLPPVGSKVIDPVLNPDAILTEIMRQGEDSDILVAAQRASEGLLFKNELSKFNYQPIISYKNKEVHFITHDLVNERMLLQADMILCSKNVTREKINNYMRRLKGFNDPLPQKGDKLICRRNNWAEMLPTNNDIALINGLTGFVTDHIDKETIEKGVFKMNFRPDFIDNDEFRDIEVNYHLFSNTSPKNPKKKLTSEERQHLMNFGPGNKFEYGYAITTHLSQGSEADNVILVVEWMGDFDTMCKSIYTAITRAKKRLFIVRLLPNMIPFYER